MLLHDLGLEGSIGSLVQAFSSDGMRVTARFAGAIPRLAENVEIGVYRVVQEAVANACRHGAPSEVSVALDVGEWVRLEVRDDGVGFDPGGGAHAFGLVSMEERALALNGRLTIESAPGRGTVVRFECPVTTAL
jgi:two-component system sensor histidine kinase DegS